MRIQVIAMTTLLGSSPGAVDGLPRMGLSRKVLLSIRCGGPFHILLISQPSLAGHVLKVLKDIKSPTVESIKFFAKTVMNDTLASHFIYRERGAHTHRHIHTPKEKKQDVIYQSWNLSISQYFCAGSLFCLVWSFSTPQLYYFSSLWH